MLKASRDYPKATMALDLKGAFGNVTHRAILTLPHDLKCDERTYTYI